MWSIDRKSTRLNSSHTIISYAVFCLKKKNLRAKPPDSPSSCWRPKEGQLTGFYADEWEPLSSHCALKPAPQDLRSPSALAGNHDRGVGVGNALDQVAHLVE